MKHKIFSVYDSVATAYITPFFLPNANMAKRGFQEAASGPNHAFGRSPGDYTLHELGEWDDTTSEFTPYEEAINHGHPQKST